MAALNFNDQRQSPDDVLASGEYPLTRRDLSEIAAMIYADAGIYLNDTKASLVYSRLSKHIRNLGLSGFREYCVLVSSPDGAQARRLFSATRKDLIVDLSAPASAANVPVSVDRRRRFGF